MRQIIRENRYLTLATANKKGEAWASPLAYAYDEAKNIFYFYSARSSRHCLNMAENPKVSVCIFNSTLPSAKAEGLQFDAVVEEVSVGDLPQVMDFYFETSFPDEEERKEWVRPVSDFLPDSAQAFYQIKPINLFINDHQDGIDFRKEIR